MTVDLSSPSPYVGWSLDGDRWVITINRPELRNALDSDSYAAIKHGVRLGSAAADARSIVIRGAAGSFAVGGDLEKFLDLLEAGPATFRSQFEATYHDPLPWDAVLGSPKPVVAVVDGLCVAGGLLLAMCCDIVIASPRSRFGIPEARVGIADKSTIELLVPSIGLMRTRYLSMTGRIIDAETAERWGLISLCVAEGADFEVEVSAVLDDLDRCSPTSQRAYKKMLNERVGTMPSDVLIDVALSGDGLEGMRAFNEKRRPAWPSLRHGVDEPD